MCSPWIRTIAGGLGLWSYIEYIEEQEPGLVLEHCERVSKGQPLSEKTTNLYWLPDLCMSGSTTFSLNAGM